MEKFRQFGDPGTGVNPFVPAWIQYRSPIPVRIVKVLVMLPVAIIRLALLLIALLWIALGELICMLIPMGVIRYPIQRLFQRMGCSLALSALGLLWIGEEMADYRRLKLPVSKNQSASPASDSKSGALIIANQQSFTDILYFGWKVSPVFVFVVADGAPIRVGIFGALKRASLAKPEAPRGRPVDLNKALVEARDGWQPVVLFPEGSRTNGSGILPWQDRTFEGMQSLDKPVCATLCALEYSKTGAYTPHHTIGGLFYHVFFICLQPWHTLKAVWLASADASAAAKGKPVLEQTALLRTLVSRMLPQAVEFSIPATTHTRFMEYWYTSQKKSYTKAQKSR